jgi:hypothetical protein
MRDLSTRRHRSLGRVCLGAEVSTGEVGSDVSTMARRSNSPWGTPELAQSHVTVELTSRNRPSPNRGKSPAAMTRGVGK